jgi:hypothetical protein
MSGLKSHKDLKVMPGSAKEQNLGRPETAAISHFGQSEAPTAATQSSTITMGLKNRAVSLSRFSKFEEKERQSMSYPFNVFYTSNEPTLYN